MLAKSKRMTTISNAAVRILSHEDDVKKQVEGQMIKKGILAAMSPLFDAFWRAAAYCLHPRVMLLSFMPLVLMALLSLGLGYLFWEPAVSFIAEWLQSHALLQSVLIWLEHVGLSSLRTMFAPLLLLAVVMPVIVLLSLLLVAVFMTPALVELVAQRRFPQLERKRGGSVVLGLFWSAGSTLVALVAIVASMPLWLIPPLVLVLPPLIWGWLTYRVFAFDALAEHASAPERRELLRKHRSTLLVMGILSGYLGAAPSLVWASGAMFVVLAPFLIPLAVWIYMLVFAFASLWFVHYLMAALHDLRAAPLSEPDADVAEVPASARDVSNLLSPPPSS